jgi:hypothetical protein
VSSIWSGFRACHSAVDTILAFHSVAAGTYKQGPGVPDGMPDWALVTIVTSSMQPQELAECLDSAQDRLQWRWLDLENWCYTLLHILDIGSTTQARRISTRSHIHILVSGRCVRLPLGHDHCLEVFALGHLRLDILDDVGKIRDVL